ncbi:DUF5133 domain-containing protein [Streptomyces sp. NPDC051310]|uniref:DUF5133 domain-containing protein n=1 Tax=Streptomyces sp. NPDC051310 TaxID=3365649 RepID=UPI0037B311C9
MAHPTVLRGLVTRYEALSAAESAAASPSVLRQREDVAYTLCVSTGTRDVRDALRVARRVLESADGKDAPVAPVASAAR